MFRLIFLCGGQGTRLWPLSTPSRPKQCLPLFQTDEGNYESMIQRVVRQAREVIPDIDILMATSTLQLPYIRQEFGSSLNVCAEPCSRNTFPAIVYAASYLADVCGVDPNELIAVCPVDGKYHNDFWEALKQLHSLAESRKEKLFLLGVSPKEPSEKYGYIIPKTNDPISTVAAFVEKPDTEHARNYIQAGGLWNCGVFLFRLQYLLDKAHKVISFSDYYDLTDQYPHLESKSFDYAVAESEPDALVMRYDGDWADLGTWDELSLFFHKDSFGNVHLENTKNVHVFNELNTPIVVLGLQNTIVAAGADGILISDTKKSVDLKCLLDRHLQNGQKELSSLGQWSMLSDGNDSVLMKITLLSGDQLLLGTDQTRDVLWIVTSGTGNIAHQGVKRNISQGEVIAAGETPQIVTAETSLSIVSVQFKENCG